MNNVKSTQQPRKKGQKKGQKKDSKQKWTSFQLWDNLEPMNHGRKMQKSITHPCFINLYLASNLFRKV